MNAPPGPPIPYGVNLPINIEAMNIEGNQLGPPMGVFRRNRAWSALIGLFFVLDLLLVGALVESFIYKKKQNHPNFLCQSSVIVARNGSRNFTSISSALAVAPDTTVGKYCIIIRSGVYHENLIIGEEKRNIALIGEGVGKTVITSNHYGVNKANATLKVFGEGFLAQDIAFEYSDGAGKDAVVLHIDADKAAFHRCSFLGYRSTLHIVRERHFFRDCRIHGTISIIYGDATSLFQNCTISVGQSTGKNKSIINVHGGAELNAGFFFQHCQIVSANDKNISFGQTYLASPLGPYSRVIIMRSFMAGLINQGGWMFDGSTSNKVYYGEFENFGAGANTKNRVHSPGVNVLSHSEVVGFTVENLIGDWLPSTGVPYWGNLEQIPNQSKTLPGRV